MSKRNAKKLKESVAKELGDKYVVQESKKKLKIKIFDEKNNCENESE